LNIIELLWADLERRVRSRFPPSLEQLARCSDRRHSTGDYSKVVLIYFKEIVIYTGWLEGE